MSDQQEEILRKLFVGGISRETSDEAFRQFFESYGELADCVIIREAATQASRGFGFVTFKSENELKSVLDAKSKSELRIDGKVVDIKRAIPRDADAIQRQRSTKVFLGGLHIDSTEESIKHYFESTYNCKVDSVDIIYEKKGNLPPGQAPRKRGFGFVTINDFDIIDRICIVHHHNIDGKDVEVKKAAPKEPNNNRGGGYGGGRGGFGRAGRGGRQNFGSGGGYGNSGGGGGYNNQNYNQGYNYQSNYSTGNGGYNFGDHTRHSDYGDYSAQGYADTTGSAYSSAAVEAGYQSYGGGYQNSAYSGPEKASTGRGYNKYGGSRGGYRPY